MEVSEARAFLVLAEELHFGRAADRLNIAQPPLSRTIRQLERRLKVQLFDRSTRKVELTVAGAALVEPATKLVEAADAAVRATRDAAAGTTGVIALGFANASMRKTVTSIARAVQKCLPGVYLDLHSSLLSAQGLEKLVSGEIDCMIGRWNTVPAEVQVAHLFREEIVVVVSDTHPLARENRSSVAMSELAEEQWITLKSGPGAALQTKFSTLARRAGFIPSVRSTAPDSWTMMVLVAAGLGVAITLDTVRDNTNEDHLHYMALKEEDRYVDVQLAWKKENKNPAFHSLLEVVKDMPPECLR